jgi:magnesium transporter
VESLLEEYIAQIHHLTSEVKQLQEEIDDTDEFVTMQLDRYYNNAPHKQILIVSNRVRNKMMRWNLALTMGTFCSSTCGLGAAIFGMNLASGLEHHPHAFFYVSSIILTTTAFGILMSITAVKKLGRFYHLPNGKNGCSNALHLFNKKH